MAGKREWGEMNDALVNVALRDMQACLKRCENELPDFERIMAWAVQEIISLQRSLEKEIGRDIGFLSSGILMAAESGNVWMDDNDEMTLSTIIKAAILWWDAESSDMDELIKTIV